MRWTNSTRPPCSCSGGTGPGSSPGPGRCGVTSTTSWPRWRARPGGTATRAGATEPGRREAAVTRLGDIISGKVFSVAPTASVAQAAETMVKGRVGSAVVVDGPWLLGIFTERDALRVAAAGG